MKKLLIILIFVIFLIGCSESPTGKVIQEAEQLNEVSEKEVIKEKEKIPKKNIYCEKFAWLNCYNTWTESMRKEYWPEVKWCIMNSPYEPLYHYRKSCYYNLAVIKNDASFCKNLFTYGIEPNLNDWNHIEYEKMEKLCIAIVNEDFEYCKKTFNEDEWRESWKKQIRDEKESCIKNIENKNLQYDIKRFDEFEGKNEEDCLKILTNDRTPRAVFRDETNKKGYQCMISLALTTESNFEYN